MCTYICKKLPNTSSSRGILNILARENDQTPWFLVRKDCKTKNEEHVVFENSKNYFETKDICDEKISGMKCKY